MAKCPKCGLKKRQTFVLLSFVSTAIFIYLWVAMVYNADTIFLKTPTMTREWFRVKPKQSDLKTQNNGSKSILGKTSKLPDKDRASNLSNKRPRQLPVSSRSPPKTGQLPVVKTEQIPGKLGFGSKLFPWTVGPERRHDGEVKHVVFVKVHKAASTTVYNVMMRFAMSRDLNVMLKRRSPHLEENGRLNMKTIDLLDHPPIPPFLFDMLCIHVVFDYQQLRPYFPKDTRYIGIVRYPWGQVLSAFNYYTFVYRPPYLRHVPGLMEFLEHQDDYEESRPLHSYTNNRMSLDMGLPLEQLGNWSYIQTFIQRTDSIFDLVLVSERFKESMVMLRRSLRWTTKDVVYLQLNSNKYDKNRLQNLDRRKKRSSSGRRLPFLSFMGLSPELRAKFTKFQRVDYALYNHFSKVFAKKVEEERRRGGFDDEVRVFSYILKQVSEFCHQVSGKGQSKSLTLHVSGSKWNDEFFLDSAECRILAVDEQTLTGYAKYIQKRRLAPLL